MKVKIIDSVFYRGNKLCKQKKIQFNQLKEFEFCLKVSRDLCKSRGKNEVKP